MKYFYRLPVDAVLLLGPTGAGKSPLGDYIARRGFAGRAAHHLDFGAELRRIAAAGESAAAHTDAELRFIKAVLEQGLLLENGHFSLAEKIIQNFLDRAGFAHDHVLVLNGIPRHAGQAKDIAAIARIHTVVLLECSAHDIYSRIRENAGGDRTGRTDDKAALIEKKLGIFRERTAPLIEHYSKQGSRVCRVDVSGTATAEDVYRRLSALAAAHPPVALVAEPPEG